jgi:hypothetical protein
LLVRAGQHDVVGAQRGVRGDDEADRAIHAGELLDGEHVLDVAETRAAQRLRQDHPQQAHRSQLLHNVVGKVAGLVPARDVGRDLALGEAAHLAPQLLLILGQSEHSSSAGWDCKS